MRYIAAWQETGGTADGGTAGGSWVPMDWQQARDTLASQLARSLSRWSGPATRPAYERALAEMREAAEPRNGGLEWRLPRYELSLIRETPG